MGTVVLRRTLAALAFLALAASVLTGSVAAGQPVRPALHVLQLNLCHSGLAECFTGDRAITTAAAAIRTDGPDVVSLNEICAGDVAPLAAALREGSGGLAPSGGTVVSAFQPAWDRRSDAGFRCRNGQEYGIGLLVHLPAVAATTPVRSAGIYPTQDPSDPEERVWLCLATQNLGLKGLAACTTHLASTSTAIASAQCGYLMGMVAPSLRAGGSPVVLSGDFNLGTGGVASCLPHGYLARDDAGVQHVVASTDLPISGVRLINMFGSTDHPGLLVTLTRPACPGSC
jgi:endonuclease/exonuclease/phosphatase family metal-dependent hydrolase